MRVSSAGSSAAPVPRAARRDPVRPDEDKDQCHFCGDRFRLVGARHVGWRDSTLDEYREAFHPLERTSPAAAGVSDKLRRNAIARKETNERWSNPPRRAGRGRRSFVERLNDEGW
jgi:hypothetical protein